MRKILVLAGLALVVALPAAAADFPGRIDNVPYALSLDASARKAELVDGKLVIVAPKGSDLYTPVGGKPVTTAPRVTFVPEGDFIFSARVDAGFGADYDGGALVVYGDEGYWAKFLFERITASESAVTSSFASPVGDNSYHVRLDASVSAVWMKIVRSGQAMRFYMSQDGKHWQILRDFTLDPSRKLAVGFASQAPLSESYTSSFSDIRFEARSAKNYWQGE